MRRLLNNLFVTTEGMYLAKKGLTVDVRQNRVSRLRVPIHTLTGIICFGRVTVSPRLMELCGRRQVLISFLDQRGRFLARVHGPVSGNVLLRRTQYRQADNPVLGSEVARAIVGAKVANSRLVLQRALRDHPNLPVSELASAIANLGALMTRLRQPCDIGGIRGLEGDGARLYFGVFGHLILAQKDVFSFQNRSRRPPTDPVNALLSFLYTLLSHDVSSALEAVGLDPAVGFLHRDRSGRPSLALDIMEEFRAFLVDRLVLSLINRQQVRAQGFRTTETGAVLMDEETRKEVLVAWQKRKQEEIQHPFLDEKMPVGMLPFAQALLLARYLRGDLDGYPPFFWK